MGPDSAVFQKDDIKRTSTGTLCLNRVLLCQTYGADRWKAVGSECVVSVATGHGGVTTSRQMYQAIRVRQKELLLPGTLG